jgi:hypothetical protein
VGYPPPEVVIVIQGVSQFGAPPHAEGRTGGSRWVDNS